MTIAGSLKQEEWVLNETFFFLLLGFFSPFFFYWQELSDMIVKVVLLMKNKVRLLLHNHVLSLSVFLQVIA